MVFRYKYLQKPLEESALPTLLQYINRWPAAQKDKIAIAIGILMSQGLATAGCLQSLTKDHLIKNGTSFFAGLTPRKLNYCSSYNVDVAADVIAIVFRTFLAEQSIDHLASTIKKGGIKDLSLFFPPNKRDDKVLEEFFRKQGLVQVADWWTKKKYAILKDDVIKAIREHLQNGDSNPDVGKDYLEIDSFLGLTAISFFLSDRVCDSGEAGRASFTRDGTHAMYLDGPDKLC